MLDATSLDTSHTHLYPVALPALRPVSLALYAGHMDRSAELLRLQEELDAATAELTAAMNEKFLAVIGDDPDVSSFDEKIAEARKKRRRAMDSLLDHATEHGW